MNEYGKTTKSKVKKLRFVMIYETINSSEIYWLWKKSQSKQFITVCILIYRKSMSLFQLQKIKIRYTFIENHIVLEAQHIHAAEEPAKMLYIYAVCASQSL